MNKKKIVSLCLIICLLATAVVGGTLAYFTDTDAAKNVMTTGKVDICQNEKDRYGNDFRQNQPLMPMVDKRDKDEKGEAIEETVVDGYYNTDLKNVVDKIITVTNEAKEGAKNEEAYVRTILAFETADVYAAGTTNVIGDAHDMYIRALGDFDYVDADPDAEGVQFTYIEIDGVKYVLAVKVYEDYLNPGNTSEPSLKQIFMAPTANNEVKDLFGDEYTILAVSQGTQIAGFDSAADALDTAFGEVTAANAQDWFNAM